MMILLPENLGTGLVRNCSFQNAQNHIQDITFSMLRRKSLLGHKFVLAQQNLLWRFDTKRIVEILIYSTGKKVIYDRQNGHLANF